MPTTMSRVRISPAGLTPDDVEVEVTLDRSGAEWRVTMDEVTLAVDKRHTLEEMMHSFAKRLGFKVVLGSVWLREAGRQPLTMRQAARFLTASGDGDPMWDEMPRPFGVCFREGEMDAEEERAAELAWLLLRARRQTTPDAPGTLR
jgi:hypothetical protein